MRRLTQTHAAVAALIRDAWLTLASRPWRTLAMVAGIILGVGSATAAVLIADTQQNQIDRRFDLQRSAYVVIQFRSPNPSGIDPAGMAAVAALEPVQNAGEFTIWAEHATVAPNSYAEPLSAPIIVASPHGLKASGATVKEGADPALVDILGRSGVVWIGQSLAHQLGASTSRPTSIVVGGHPYTVGGIITSNTGFTYLDASVVMSRTLAAATQTGPVTVRMLARVRPGSAAAVGAYGLRALDPTRNQDPVDATPPDGALLLSNVANDMRIIGVALGAFVGFVGMVAVANTLMMSVNQRSRELGLRSALGWNRHRIAGLILTESAIAGLFAAVVGASLGMMTAATWCLWQGWQLIVARELAPTTITSGTIAAILGGLLPAHRAASLSPMTAMRA